MPKSTPLTLEIFEEALLPRIEEILEEKTQKYRVEVIGFKEEVMSEVQGLRNEVTATLHQYRRTTDRVEKIENQLNITPEN